ncbi:MAG: MEDS domain-containing protein [Bacteroidota bacterium]|nr:MEDS domain-containing protein [Bacteroidota bacterium]
MEGFIVGGLDKGECVILIATSAHLKAITHRLNVKGYDVESLLSTDQLIPQDAQEALDSFMVDGMPDADLFNDLVASLISRVKNQRRHARAFGEMVAILWAQG